MKYGNLNFLEPSGPLQACNEIDLPFTPLYRRLGGPQGRSGRAENLAPPGVYSRTVQPTMDIRNFNLGMSQVRQRGKIGVYRPLIYIQLLPPLTPVIFICPSSTQYPKENYS